MLAIFLGEKRGWGIWETLDRYRKQLRKGGRSEGTILCFHLFVLPWHNRITSQGSYYLSICIALFRKFESRVQPKGRSTTSSKCSSPYMLHPSHVMQTHAIHPSFILSSLPPRAERSSTHDVVSRRMRHRKKKKGRIVKDYSQEAESKGICAPATIQTITSIISSVVLLFFSFPRCMREEIGREYLTEEEMSINRKRNLDDEGSKAGGGCHTSEDCLASTSRGRGGRSSRSVGCLRMVRSLQRASWQITYS